MLKTWLKYYNAMGDKTKEIITEMKIKNSYLIIMIILTLAGGLLGTYLYATSQTLSREIKDFFSMIVLIASIIIAGILIVKALSQKSPGDETES